VTLHLKTLVFLEMEQTVVQSFKKFISRYYNIIDELIYTHYTYKIKIFPEMGGRFEWEEAKLA